MLQFCVLDSNPDELERPSGHLAGTLQALRIHLILLHDTVQRYVGSHVCREKFCSVFSTQSKGVF